jgi:predicted metalloprotease with PDZ domain
MPSELRFCRNCGYRLGEGPAEYTETVRFQDGRPIASAGNPADGFAGGFPPAYESPGQMAPVVGGAVCRRKKRLSGMTWIFFAVILFFSGSALLSLFVPRFNRGGPQFGIPASPRSYVGVNGFENTEGGVTFDSVDAPGGPADKAELVGGDVITTFDGQQITSDDQIMDLLKATPIGKTVDVVFIRDGVTKSTKLTTISKADFDQLVRTFRSRAEGQGQLGINDRKVVTVLDSKIRGVWVKVDGGRAAALAGMKDDDVVIEIDGIPIRTVAEFTARIRRAVPYSTVPIKIVRAGETLTIPVKMGRQ